MMQITAAVQRRPTQVVLVTTSRKIYLTPSPAIIVIVLQTDRETDRRDCKHRIDDPLSGDVDVTAVSGQNANCVAAIKHG